LRYITKGREALLKGKAQCGDLLVLTSLDPLLFKSEILFTYVTKQATLTKTSSVLSLPSQLVFPVIRQCRYPLTFKRRSVYYFSFSGRVSVSRFIKPVDASVELHDAPLRPLHQAQRLQGRFRVRPEEGGATTPGLWRPGPNVINYFSASLTLR
jgi:hypothetical protein